jgi:inosine kinase
VRFPGRRKHKHYFPVNAVDPLVQRATPEEAGAKTHAVGVDQTLVDIDARVPEALLTRYELPRGASTARPSSWPATSSASRTRARSASR